MKLKTILMFAGILAVQIAVTYAIIALFSSGAPAAKAPGPPPPAAAGGGDSALSSPSNPTPENAPEAPPAAARKGLGKPFDYKHAVNGDIPGLPDSQSVRAAILVDLDTRAVIWAKNPKSPGPIASMTKMMTALLVMEKAAAKPGYLDEKVPVSQKAAEQGGSQVFLDVRESFTVRDLLRCAMIRSANDAAYLLAEHLGGGSADTAVQRMCERAKALGLDNMRLFNPHGLPGDTAAHDNVATPEEMALVAERLLEYPELVQISSTAIDKLKREVGKNPETLLSSTNYLVRNKCPGVNGMKTGYTDRALFCLTATCERDGRRLVAVVMGCPDRKTRDNFVAKLLDWGYKRAAELRAAAAAGVAPPPPSAPKAPSSAPSKARPTSTPDKKKEAKKP